MSHSPVQNPASGWHEKHVDLQSLSPPLVFQTPSAQGLGRLLQSAEPIPFSTDLLALRIVFLSKEGCCIVLEDLLWTLITVASFIASTNRSLSPFISPDISTLACK